MPRQGLLLSATPHRRNRVDDLYVVMVLGILVLLGSMLSVELGLSVAIVEIVLGVFAGNALGIQPRPWLDLIASFASIVLTFLAGAEVDPDLFKAKLKQSLLIGGASFLIPFGLAWAFAQLLLGWDLRAAQIAAAALSTTSLAVVYAVLVETGLTNAAIGKLIMASTFVTDFGTAAALSLLFIQPSSWLPAFILGLAVARVFQRHRQEQLRFRVVAFAFLTPFFFLKGGMNISVPAVLANLGLVGLLLAVKLVAKFAGVYPFARLYVPLEAWYMTLLMSTGLTFGTISSLYGLNAGIIDQAQFSVLVTVVVLTAIVPTAVAQRWFTPRT